MNKVFKLFIHQSLLKHKHYPLLFLLFRITATTTRTVALTGGWFVFLSLRFPSAFFLFCSVLPLVPCFILSLPLWSSQTSLGAAAWRWRRSWGWSVLWSGDVSFFLLLLFSFLILLVQFLFALFFFFVSGFWNDEDDGNAGSGLNDFLYLHSFLLLVFVSLSYCSPLSLLSCWLSLLVSSFFFLFLFLCSSLLWLFIARGCMLFRIYCRKVVTAGVHHGGEGYQSWDMLPWLKQLQR